MMLSILLSIGTSACASAAVAFFFLYNLVFGMTYSRRGCFNRHRLRYLDLELFVAMITPVITTQIGWKSYLIFTCTNFAFIPFLYFFYPETSNLTLEEIDYLFTSREEVTELGQGQQTSEKVASSQHDSTESS
ncbi:unnamed protein product [Parascedosporium putredinis]|uniref:Uncharacterized protein n=1 Tax=Parascedosporium putredinis TaxID=1442378 RepID=A0A9P1H4Q9_9PEZI|nr:unnamed protein product [Parascedosporium putredinis]CAI7997004.1 unnamed protein product [Parascedosporium putredinis]